MLKIKDLLKDLIETQKQINENIKKLNETKNSESQKLCSTIYTVDNLENSLKTNIYTKTETIEAINMEIDYKKDFEKAQKEYPDLLELVRTISTIYPNMDKYGVLDLAKMYSKEYKVEKK